MKLDELASLVGKTKDELIEQLKQTDVIELRLTEKADKEIKDNGSMEII